MDHAAGWKPSAYTPGIAALILERIEDGETVRQITADPAMPCYATVYRWTKVIPEFGDAWRALRGRMAAAAVRSKRQKAEAQVWMRARQRQIEGKPPRDWVSGRRSSYTPERMEAVAAALVYGAPLSAVLGRDGLPSAKVFYGWLRRFPEAREIYVAACEARANWLLDDQLEIARAATPQSARDDAKRIARIRGQIGRMAPRTWR